MVDSDHDMRDIMVWEIGSWEAESEDERGAIPTTWNLVPVARGGAVLTTEIELKLQKLTAVDYDYCNWSWLLDPNRTHVPPVLLKVRPQLRVCQPWLLRGQGSRGK